VARSCRTRRTGLGRIASGHTASLGLKDGLPRSFQLFVGFRLDSARIPWRFRNSHVPPFHVGTSRPGLGSSR